MVFLQNFFIGRQNSVALNFLQYNQKLPSEESGWDARIRTWACGDQNPVPYRLATSQLF